MYICKPFTEGNDFVAQLVEHNTFNVGVLGSSPSGITRNHSEMSGFFRLYGFDPDSYRDQRDHEKPLRNEWFRRL